ncbi:MAG: cation:proton antiporter [Actinomycetota bacterium]|nr:cation:proton antiporter [Actinomycetota bacterium]
MDIDVVLIVVGAAVLVLGLLSQLLKRLFVSVALASLALGVVLGPEALAVLDPVAIDDARHLLKELTRVGLAISLTAIGLQVTGEDIKANLAPAGLLLSFGMAGMWLMTSLGAGLLLDLPLGVALLLGGVLTPTDPVVASALVTGKLAEANLPRWLRRTVQIESGANDGLAVVFVLVPALVLTESAAGPLSLAGEIGKEVGLAVAIALPLGYLAGKGVNTANRWQAVEAAHVANLGVGLGLLALGSVHLLGGSGVLAAFVSALVFSLVLEEKLATRLEHLQDTVEKLFIPPIFVLFGVVLPWSEWTSLGWAGVVFALWVLLLRRPPVVPLVLAWSVDRRSSAFLSWFGPLGAAAIYYSLLVERYELAQYPKLFGAATLAVTASIVVQSVTATPGVRRYARRSPLATLVAPLAHDVEER